LKGRGVWIKTKVKNMSQQKRSTNFDRMLVEAVQSNFSFFAWQSIGGNVEKCELKVKAYRKDYNEIELELKNPTDNISKIISGNRIINIYVPEQAVSFSSELKVITADKKIKIYPPKDFTFFERRKHERLNPTKSCFVTFEHNRQQIKKSIYDISLGGIAIILSKSDKIVIPKGKEYPVITVEIGIRKLKVQAVCINSFSIDRFKLDNLPYGGYKIAFRFMEMSQDDREYLTEFVTHQSLIQNHLKKAN
jgi:c-di-GMP-binding flagellar brake protein YcgR